MTGPHLMAWLREQVDDDEQAIRRACGYSPEAFAHAGADTWTMRRNPGRPEDVEQVWAKAGALRPHFTGIELPVLAEPVGRYLERFDPAREMREVEAKRRRIERHQPRCSGHARPYQQCGPSVCHLTCDDCGNDWPCADIRDDAAIYADRPGYREEWRP